MAVKPKVALIADGKVPTKLGRGRLNDAQKTRIKELVAGGMEIEGYPSPNTTGSTQAVAPEKVVRVAPAGVGVKQVIEPKAEVRQRETFKAMTTIDQKQVKVPGGNLTVCDNCRNSFTHCNCGDPRAFVNGRSIPVWFV